MGSPSSGSIPTAAPSDRRGEGGEVLRAAAGPEPAAWGDVLFVAPELVGETSRVMIQAVIEKHARVALSHLDEIEKASWISKAKPTSHW